ncbi:MAG TPA: protein kinase [Pirellulaceae bacterium]|nr:protein kinase [Pirellulaceae bacterium]
MTSKPQRAKEIFVELVRSVPSDEWELRLDAACGGDRELRDRVSALLRAHVEPGSFLEQPAVAVASLSPTIDQPITERPGTVIGRYKLLEQIGEGGFGVVFMAEQQEPVRRKLALKIIKPGMDTKEVIARFEAERQALAIMDHPNIAKVLDAGATESGRPFFVMELVRGISITDFCDQNSLTTRERLELFASVCQAVQHAHQKGVIHRDIKPSNVLVTMHDDKPVPKVIDFGVAKATNQQLTERTFFTRFAQMIGTPLYMSPEQAQMSGLDVDTRSDIYSLGVLLYELLTGTTPFDQKRIREAAYDELLRIIREEEPPKPSLRISTLAETLPSVAAHRKLEPKKLSALVRGELDWIVMKALEKDRVCRYETANGFAADIERYLKDEPVEACPPSAAYRFRKFARRNKALLSTAAAIGIALLLGVTGTTWQAVRATRAEGVAKTERELAEQERDRALEAEQLANDRLTRLTETQRAAQIEEQARVNRGLGNREKAEQFLLQAIAIRRTVQGFAHPDTGRAIQELGRMYLEQERYEEREALLKALYAVQPDLGSTAYALPYTMSKQGKYAEVLEFLDQEVRDPSLLQSNLKGDALWQLRHFDEAITAYRQSVEAGLAQPRKLTHNKSNIHSARVILARRLNEHARQLAVDPIEERRAPKRALELAEEAVEMFPENGKFWMTLGQAHFRAGDEEKAIEALDKADDLGADDAHIAVTRALIYWNRGEHDEAERLYQHLVELTKTTRPFSWDLFGLRAELETKLGAEYLESRATTVHRAARSLQEANDLEGAATLYRRAAKFCAELIEESPQINSLKLEFVRTKVALAEVLNGRSGSDEAQELAAKSIRALEELPDAGDEVRKLRIRAESLLHSEAEKANDSGRRP